MQEFSSISVSSYEAGSLAERLTEQSRAGWDVVAIVPTGSSVTAYLAREASDDDEPSESKASAPAETSLASTFGSSRTESIEPTEEVEEAAPAAAASTPDDTASSAASWSVLADQAAKEDTASVEASIPPVKVPESTISTPTPDPVSEPGGWAIAPESASPTPAAATATAGTPAASIPASSGAASIAAAANEVASTPTHETTPAVSTPAAADTGAATAATAAAAQTQQTQAAASSAAPAGWYADPSSRYELRYWDGTQWTEHVSRGGQQFTDPPVA